MGEQCTQNPLSEGKPIRWGGHQNPCTEMCSVAENRRLMRKRWKLSCNVATCCKMSQHVANCRKCQKSPPLPAVPFWILPSLGGGGVLNFCCGGLQNIQPPPLKNATCQKGERGAYTIRGQIITHDNFLVIFFGSATSVFTGINLFLDFLRYSNLGLPDFSSLPNYFWDLRGLLR